MTITSMVPGYAKVRINGARGLVIESCREAIETVLESQTLYDFAAAQADARQFVGRAPVYGITLGGDCGNVVVRHGMRGGVLSRMGSDLFLPPTRGLRELINSLRLRLLNVPTPEVVAVISYRAGPVLRRSDVATREIPESHDLSVVLKAMDSESDRLACLRATGRLLSGLARAGAHHPDLNSRNILVTWDSAAGAEAHVLDVDRIRFHLAGDPMVAQANITRLERSLAKLRDAGQLKVTADEIIAIREAAFEPAA